MVVDREKLIIELRADVLIPGYYSNSKRKGQVPCEVISVYHSQLCPELA